MKPLFIIQERCNLCKICLTQCSREKIIVKDEKITVTKSGDCIGCGHCYAICPNQAIMPDNEVEPDLLKYTSFTQEEVMHFLRSRRSHRLYQDKEISEELILRLSEFARFAPTGTNAEPIQYLFVKDPKKIEHIRKEIMKVYKKFNSLMNCSLIRFVVSLFDKRVRKGQLKKDLNRMIARYEEGEDPLFYNAPLIAFLYASKYESSMARDDSCYALYNMVLGAEVLGLSSCINGLAIIGLSFNKKLRKELGFTKDKKAYTCAIFGYSKYQYKSLVHRKKARIKIM